MSGSYPYIKYCIIANLEIIGIRYACRQKITLDFVNILFVCLYFYIEFINCSLIHMYYILSMYM